MVGPTLTKHNFKVGDLVVVHCRGTTGRKYGERVPWYSGVPGLLIHFDLWGKPNEHRGDPIVQYGNRTVRLASTRMELVHAAR